MRLPRMTTRPWMIAVAVVGFGVGIERMADRRSRHLSRAELHEVNAQYFGEGRRDLVFGPERFGPDGRLKKEISVALDQKRDYHAALARKYRLAASRPWLPVSPEPPDFPWLPVMPDPEDPPGPK